MSKKHQIVLPSLTKSTKEKLSFFPLTTKLDKHNIELLKEHGYKVNHGIQEVIYKLLPHRIFKPYLLYAFIFLQDLIKGRIVNSERYPYFLLFLKSVYNVTLDKKQSDAFDEFFKNKKSVSFSYNGKQELVGTDSDVLVRDTPSEEVPEVVEKPVKKIILLSSNTVGVGKTTTCNKIVEQLPNSKRVAFAGFIRDQLSLIFQVSGIDPKYLKEPLYSKVKNKPTEVDSEYNPIVIRDLLCDYSDLIQKHFGENYWATSMLDYVLDSDYDYFLVDDLRRPIELNYLKQTFGEENILTVYLTKVDKEVVKLSETSSNYEGQLDPSIFDIQFEFNSDWSNTNELIEQIKSKFN